MSAFYPDCPVLRGISGPVPCCPTCGCVDLGPVTKGANARRSPRPCGLPLNRYTVAEDCPGPGLCTGCGACLRPCRRGEL